MTIWQLISATVKNKPLQYIRYTVIQTLRSSIILIPGLIMRQLFDSLTEDGVLSGANPLDLLPWGWLILLAVVAIARVLSIVSGTYLYWTVTGANMGNLRNNLFQHLLRRADVHRLPAPVGDVINRLSVDSHSLAHYIIFYFSLASTTTAALIAFAIMLTISWQMALLTLLPVLFMGIIFHVTRHRLESYQRANRQAHGRLTAFLGEMFSAVQAIQVASAQNSITHQLKKLNQTRQQAAIRERLFTEVFTLSIFYNIVNLTTGLILLLAGRWLRLGMGETAVFTVGDFTLFIFLIGPLMDAMFYLGQAFSLHRQNIVALERVVKLLDGDAAKLAATEGTLLANGRSNSAISNSASENTALLTLKNLSFQYDDVTGIHDINLALKAGSFTAVIGRVGSGKTTLLRAALGLLSAEGDILWQGQKVSNPATFFVPPISAYTPQVPYLFSETVQENILLGLEETAVTHNLPQALHAAILEEEIATLANGLDTIVGPRGMRLSGGQQQRTAAARMFIRHPQLYVMDDLSSALDMETEAKLWARLENHPATYLVVSHRPAVIKRADWIVVMENGRIAQQGALDILRPTSPLIQELV